MPPSTATEPVAEQQTAAEPELYIPSYCKQTAVEVVELEHAARADGKKLRVEVIADASGTFCGNGLTFETAKQAIDYGQDLYGRWTLVREFRVVIG